MTSKRLRIRFSVIEDQYCGAHVKDIDREYTVEDDEYYPTLAIREQLMRVFDDIHARYIEWVYANYFEKDPNEDRPIPTSEEEMRAECERLLRRPKKGKAK